MTTCTAKSLVSEYASVGYMAKRIQMRKNRFLALQKMAEQKKNEAMNATNAALNDGGPPDHHGIPKQTVSTQIFPSTQNDKEYLAKMFSIATKKGVF